MRDGIIVDGVVRLRRRRERVLVSRGGESTGGGPAAADTGAAQGRACGGGEVAEQERFRVLQVEMEREARHWRWIRSWLVDALERVRRD